MINDLPTVFEVVNGKKIGKQSSSNNGSSKSKSSSKVRPLESHPKHLKGPPPPPKEEMDEEDEMPDEAEDEEEEDGEHGDTLCGACGESYASDEFWICCDICEQWFHGKCVKITPARAEHIKHYKCPSCSKRARPS